MRLVNDISDLHQYTKCKNDLCYHEPFDSPADILIQDTLPPTAPGSTFDVHAYVMSADGTQQLSNLAGFFDCLIGQDIKGNPYFNLRLTEDATLPTCFLLRIVITALSPCFTPAIATKTLVVPDTDNGVPAGSGTPTAQTIYDKYTEPYQLLSAYCAGQSSMLLEGAFACYDMQGGYYGDAKNVLQQICAGSSENCQFQYASRHIIRGRLKRLPTDIKRTVSEYNCRPVRTDYAELYTLEGFDLYPEWKVREIERVFTAAAVTLNGKEYVFRGGAIFEAEKIACSCSFLLAAKIERCTQSTEYGCEADCQTLCTYYIIPGAAKNQTYLDNSGTLIGATFTELLNWFRSRTGVNTVTEIDVTGVSCAAVGAFKVDSDGTLPGFFYWGEAVSNKKVYGQLGNCDSFDVCKSQPEKCVTPAITSAEMVSLCDTPGIASAEFVDPVENTNCLVSDEGDWVVQSGAVISRSPSGLVTLQFTVRNTAYASMSPTTVITEYIAILAGQCGLGSDNQTIASSSQPAGAMPAGSTLYVQTDGSLLYSGVVSAVNSSYAEITINITYQI